nr:acyltransferase [Rhodospirillales bacterium]
MHHSLDARRLDGLTGLRALAAVWVLAFHYSRGPLRPLGTAHASPFVDAGFLGVDLFFILSGFVIWH